MTANESLDKLLELYRNIGNISFYSVEQRSEFCTLFYELYNSLATQLNESEKIEKPVDSRLNSKADSRIIQTKYAGEAVFGIEVADEQDCHTHVDCIKKITVLRKQLQEIREIINKYNDDTNYSWSEAWDDLEKILGEEKE